MANQDAAKLEAGDPSAGGSSKALPVLPLIQTIAVVGALGFLYYSKMLYKRPRITEEAERDRLAMAKASPAPPPVSTFIRFDPITVNIKSIPGRPLPADGTFQQIQGKLHFATVSFALEIRDKNQEDVIEGMRPFIQDQLVQILGKKQFNQLTTVQGRYILAAEIVDYTNHFIFLHSLMPTKEPLVKSAYFTQFIVQ